MKGSFVAWMNSRNSRVVLGRISSPTTTSYSPLRLKLWSMSMPTARAPAFSACSIFRKMRSLSL